MSWFARSLEEAKAIEPAEILVVPYLDLGWAPYFLRAAGLAFEIGGTLSSVSTAKPANYGCSLALNRPDELTLIS